MTMDAWLAASRMIGVFGKREPELAAIKIVDHYGNCLMQPVDPAIFKSDYEKHGYRLLCQWGLVVDGVPQPEFWLRVKGH